MFISMKILLSNILLIITLTLNGQVNSDVSKFAGLYFGTQSYGESMNGIGYYYFNSDFSFIFIRTGLSLNTKTKEFKDRFNDTLIGYGKGHWHIKDNAVAIKFENIPNENIQNSKLKYSGYSKAPFDSLFLNISVTNYDYNSLGVAVITFPKKNTGAATDTLGFSKASLFKSDNLDEIVVSKQGYFDLPITLSKNFNVHELTVTLAKADESNVELVSKVEYAFKFHYENKMIVFDGKLKKQNAGKEKLMQIVKNSFSKFPMQKTFLQKILDELK